MPSDWHATTRGCPQGLGFGPLHWNVFQNDLHFSTDENRLIEYADNHQLFSVAKSSNEADRILTRESKKTSLSGITTIFYKETFQSLR